MGITDTSSRVAYSGNGSTTAFAFNFRVFDTDELTVILRNNTTNVETTQTLTTHYTVTLNSGEGGTVTMLTAPASGETLYIGKEVAETQPESITTGNLPAATLEQMSDRLTMLIHQVREITRRVPLLVRSTTSVDKTMAEPVDGELLGWDASGNLINYSAQTVGAGTTVLDEDDMASDSATAVPTQQSVKAYVDQQGSNLATQTFTTTSTVGGTIEHARAFNAITLTLPTASGNSGKQIRITNTNLSETAVVIDADGVETIAGSLTQTLRAPQESITIVSNGTSWDILTWYNRSGRKNVRTETTTYTATLNDEVILCDTSGGAFTLTLPAASGNSGKIYEIKYTDSGFANALTIDGDGSETIDGSTTTTLNTQNETIKIICDGSNWEVLERRIPRIISAYTPNWSAVGTGAFTQDFQWHREGMFIVIRGNLIVTTAWSTGSATNFDLPGSLTMLAADIPSAATKAIGSSSSYNTGAGTGYEPVSAVVNTGSNVVNFVYGGSGSFIQGTDMGLNDELHVHDLRIPITGWND